MTEYDHFGDLSDDQAFDGVVDFAGGVDLADGDLFGGTDYVYDAGQYDLIGSDPDEGSLWEMAFSDVNYDGVYDSVDYTDFGTNPYVAA